jgi:thioredoxin-related protein
MKRLIFLFLSSIFAASFLHAGEITWVNDLAKGLSQAKTDNKVAMIDVYTDWCTWCKELDKKTYKNEKVIELSKNFINIKVNPEKDKAVAEFIKNYNVNGFPTVLFVEYNGALVLKIGGFLAADGFVKKMDEVPKIVAKIKLYTDQYNTGDFTHSKELLRILVDASRIDEAVPIFERLKNEKKFQKINLADFYIEIGLAFAMQNKIEQARPYFIDAETIFPDTKTGFTGSYYHAYSEYLLGKKNDAVSIVNKVLKNPKLPPDWKTEFNNLLKSFSGKS